MATAAVQTACDPIEETRSGGRGTTSSGGDSRWMFSALFTLESDQRIHSGPNCHKASSSDVRRSSGRLQMFRGVTRRPREKVEQRGLRSRWNVEASE
ncbi:hypothetical protein F2P81_008422 [Scophthalmus maximus]|uniref:Uncharacterized protein n=1 Tax=Scophthalmus maximus TaxID=52904 RepID=A0A6A4T289_SCOMX|nr:hypothetical protein F2P81_008422 [Scophthalmus maximus]